MSSSGQPTGELERARRAVAALAALRECGDGDPSPSQRQALAGWPGWGPLARAFNWSRTEAWTEIARHVRDLISDEDYEAARSAVDTAFYTPDAVTAAVWDIVTGLGFSGGRILEPGCGGGNFIAAAPAGLAVSWTGVEADRVSARIASKLHPGARVACGRLEKTPLRYGGFDLVVGNVPFSREGPYDPAAPPGLSLHNYFIWRALSAVRRGGLVAVVTSRWTLDTADPAQRGELARLGTLVGAIRLPGAILAEGGTRAVTDVVVFHRGPDDGGTADESWLRPARTPAGLDTTVSSYFLRRPEMVLGELRNRGGVQHGMTLDVVVPEGQDAAAMLARAAGRVVEQGRGAGLTWVPAAMPAGDDSEGEPAADPAADGTFTLHSDGTITRQDNGQPVPVRATTELVALIGLRDAAVALFAAEADRDMPEAQRSRARDHARGLYQKYVARFGPLNRSDLSERPDPDGEPGAVLITRRRPPMGGFRSDPDFVTTLALEIWDDSAQAANPAPILLRHVNAPARRKEHTHDAAEALLLCLDIAGRVDLAVIAGLLGTGKDAVPALLEGQIWEDPETGHWVTADEYLSGNVRVKLAAARRAAGTSPGRWDRQVAALETVQPADLTPDEISVQLGSPWIPPRVIELFIADLLGFRLGSLGRSVDVTFAPLTSAWEVHATTEARRQPAATAEWGTLRVNACNLIEHALNGTTPVVYDPVDGSDERVRNPAETALAADKIRDLQERFAEWLWEEPARADAMARLYNDRFNCTRVRRYDGSLLTFPGLAGGFTPYQSQLDMVWRAVCTPAALCGHAVGAGKTATMVMTAMTLRRLGLARKPAMIVPNHLLEQETAEARRLFPGAKILMVTREDLTPQRRRAFAAKVGARDWDLILMTHQQFMALPVSPLVQARFLAELIEELDAAAMEDSLAHTRTAKKLAAMRKKLRARHEALLDAPRDLGVTFEMTGIDYLLVDEAHFYKNREMTARAEGFSTAGSKRADDLAMKFGWLRERNPDGRCGALFTGTPISNALSELHVLFRYLCPGRLAELGLTSFDAFAAQYIRYATQTEVAPDGSGFRSHRRPVRYCNLPELRSMLGEVADIRTRAVLALAGPAVRLEHVAVPPQPELAAFTARLVERADRIRQGGLDPREDNMLAVCGDGRRAALDLRLAGITPTGPGKLEAAAERVAAVYHATGGNVYSDPAGGNRPHSRPGALQLVFCDQGTPDGHGDDQVYGRFRALLAAAGVPSAAVAFIHSAKTHGDRAALFARCRTGEVRILIGSTEKCGTGVNIQQRLIAVHHLDAPWRPADVEQRDGRGDRPGNENPELLVVRYVTERSFDAYMWQALQRKAWFIGQILTGSLDVREVEDGGNPQLLSYGELKALATGQPLLMDLSRVNSEIARLRNGSAGHKRTQARLYGEYTAARQSAAEYGRQADELDRIARAAGDAGDERVLRSSRGERVVGSESICAEIREALARARERQARFHAGHYRGISVSFEAVTRYEGAPRVRVSLAVTSWANHPYRFTAGARAWTKKGPGHLLAEIDAALDAAGDLAGERRERQQAQDARAAEISQYLGQEWPHRQELAAALAERARIEAEIDAQVEQAVTPAAGTMSAQEAA